MKTMTALAMALAILLIALSGPAADDAATDPQPATRPASPEASADEVIKQLLMNRSQEPVLPEIATGPATPPDSIAPKSMVKPLPMPPGAMVVNRVGRLIRDDATGWWRLHFESEKDVLYEAPVRVLPNRLLEAMEGIMENSGKSRILFKVTGEVTQYRGNRHLLIRRMLIKREMGSM